MEGKDATPRKHFYYYYDKNNLKAVRRDNWKLVLPHQSQLYETQLPGNDGFPGTTTSDNAIPLALYDLRRDPSERYDVKKLYPEIVSELKRLAEMAREDLGDDITKRTGKNLRPPGTAK
jgi:arylsulfatase